MITKEIKFKDVITKYSRIVVRRFKSIGECYRFAQESLGIHEYIQYIK